MLGILDKKEELELAVKNAEAIMAKADSEQRELTPEESAEYDQLMDQRDKLDKDIERRERLAAAKTKGAEVQERKTVSAQPAAPERRVTRIEPVRSTVKLRSFKTHEDANLAGRWLMGALFNHTESRNHCLDRGLEYRALSEGVNTAGGFLVPSILEQAIIDNRDRYGLLRQEVTPTPMSSDTVTIPVQTGGLTAYFIGENKEATESEQTWSNVTLSAKKCMVLTKHSTEVAEDAIIGLAEKIAQDMGEAIAEKEDRCWLLGDGTAAYGGIYGLKTWFDANDAGSYKSMFVAATNHDTYAEYDATDIGTAMGRLPLKYRQGAKLYMSPTTWGAVFERLMLAAGGNTTVTVGEGAQLRYNGYPVAFSELLTASATPTTDNSNVSIFMFGNANRTTLLGDRRGIVIKASEDRHIELGQVVVVGSSRFDIVNHNLGDTSVPGSMISLQGE